MPGLSFLLVGTPRSGTTLTQRLCCELPGVAMPPETHFLQLFAPDLLARRRFPLTAAQVAQELDRFRSLPTSARLELDARRVLEQVHPSCAGLTQLFAALVVALCPASAGATVFGEKTPEHLLWWRLVTAAQPDLKIVGVVRDPRAVAASHRAVPWGIRDAAELAEEWALDQRELRSAARRLGPARCVVLRYEDVVRDPDAARARLGGFLGRPPTGGTAAPAGIVQPWEWWKAAALAPVTADRAAAWRDTLEPQDVRIIEAVAAREMAAFGYPPCGAASDGSVPAVDRTATRARLAARLLRLRRLAPLVLPAGAP